MGRDSASRSPASVGNARVSYCPQVEEVLGLGALTTRSVIHTIALDLHLALTGVLDAADCALSLARSSNHPAFRLQLEATSQVASGFLSRAAPRWRWSLSSDLGS